MSQYVILQYEMNEDEGTLLARRGWYEEDYQDIVNEDIAEPVEYFETESEAWKEWNAMYSKTGFFQLPDYSWTATIYALCKRVECTEDETEVILISSGDLTLRDIEEA